MNAQAQLDGFIDRFTPEVVELARQLLRKMKMRLPGATIMVYDNYNALAIGFGPSDKAGQAILSLAVMPRWVTLCFLYGVGLPDPDGLLSGSGNRVRHIRLHTPEAFDDPRVQALIALALERCEPPFDESCEQRLIIKSISAKQRPRRPKD
ncbi:MAG: DUF1801 domain-containing protein [Sphingomicrobium sp.]